jgi:hypothetical protein
MDWLMLAVIATFLAGAAMAQAIDWIAGGLGARGQGGSEPTLANRLVVVGADTIRQGPVIFRRP